MDYFIARVILHRIDGSDDYKELHSEMEALKFRQTIVGRKGTYKLPRGLYVLELNQNNVQNKLSAIEIRSKVIAVVNKVIADETVYKKRANNPPTVLIFHSTENTYAAWSDLEMETPTATT